MSSGIAITVPGIELVSEANAHEVFWYRQRRAKNQHRVIGLALRSHRAVALPCEVRIVRIAPTELDTDNLQGAAKHVRDAVAAWLTPRRRVITRGKRRGETEIVGDDRDPRISWHVGQEIGRPGVRIIVRPWDAHAAGSRVRVEGEVTHAEVSLSPAHLADLARQLSDLAAGGHSVTARVHALSLTFHRTETTTR